MNSPLLGSKVRNYYSIASANYLTHIFVEQMGKTPWRCSTTALKNCTELQMETIRRIVDEISVLTKRREYLGQMSKWLWRCTIIGLNNTHNFEVRKSVQWYRYALWTMGKPIWCKREINMMLYNLRSRQFHKTLNGENPSSDARNGTTIPLQLEGLRG